MFVPRQRVGKVWYLIAAGAVWLAAWQVARAYFGY